MYLRSFSNQQPVTSNKQQSLYQYLLLLCFLSGLGFLSGCQGVYFKGQTAEKEVALTFDDGPDPVYTPQVLDILDRFQVKATFFLIGRQARAYPDLVREIRARGHEIGNHSYGHPFYLAWLGTDQIRKEILETQEVLGQITGEHPRYFRAPLGWVSNDLVGVCRELNLPIINGSVKVGDVSNPGTDQIMTAVLSRAGNGDIIILHDSGGVGAYRDRSQTLESLPMIIKKLQDDGYLFVFINELIQVPSGNRKASSRISADQDRTRPEIP